MTFDLILYRKNVLFIILIFWHLLPSNFFSFFFGLQGYQADLLSGTKKKGISSRRVTFFNPNSTIKTTTQQPKHQYQITTTKNIQYKIRPMLVIFCFFFSINFWYFLLSSIMSISQRKSSNSVTRVFNFF